MSHTLLLRLVAPMQSWGVQSNFSNRDTALEPSKSGVLGLLCAALGKPRDEAHPDNTGKRTLAELSRVRMGVRVDREGRLMRDYHTAGKGGFLRARGDIERDEVVVSERFYLADAAFLVGLESDDLELLRTVDGALRHPHWFLFLGRKAFIPSEPIWVEDGVQEAVKLEDALDPAVCPRLRPPRKYDDPRMRLMIEVRPGESGEITRRDVPICFITGQRDFGVRHLRAGLCQDHLPLPQEAT
jgi:CRISPR system Cascade subunit CasD